MQQPDTPTDLKPHRMVFAMHFLACGDGVEAARRTGYRTPYNASHRLLKRSDVKKMIRSFRAHNIEKIRQGAVEELQSAHARAVISLVDYLEITPDGNVSFRNLEELTPESQQALAGWESDSEGRLTSIRLSDPLTALSELARLAWGKRKPKPTNGDLALEEYEAAPSHWKNIK